MPPEERKTYPWLLALRDCETVAADMPHTRLVQVMDREADFFELFDEWRTGARRTELLVRAKHNRRTTSPDAKLFDGVKASEARLQFELSINRQSARPKMSKQKARAARSGRSAGMTLRYQPVELRPPEDLRDRESIPLWIVHILEEHPPAGEKPVEWFLLTTMEVTSTDLARRLLHWYGLRWRIEDWHRVLKSGCGIEELRNETGERIKRAVAIYMVVAWHVILMTLLGREVPELPAEVLFTDIELKVLTAFAKNRRDLKPPQNLGDAVRLVGRMGGHMGRKKDLPPGHQVLWIGYMMLGYMAAGYLLGRQDRDPD